MNLLRRGFLKSMSILPFGVGASLEPNSQSTEIREESAPFEVALDVMRLFNTMELHHNLKQGKYATRDELFQILSAAWFTDPKKPPPKAASAKSFYTWLRLNEEQIIPGWKMTLRKAGDESGYLLSMIDVLGAKTGRKQDALLLSDELGVIYFGDFDGTYDPNAHQPGATSVPGVRPIDERIAKRSFLGTAFQRLAFAAQGVHPDTSCNCNCNCTSSGQCYCGNTGCRDCTWCCAGSCTQCVFCTGKGCACCTP